MNFKAIDKINGVIHSNQTAPFIRDNASVINLDLAIKIVNLWKRKREKEKEWEEKEEEKMLLWDHKKQPWQLPINVCWGFGFGKHPVWLHLGLPDP